MIFTISNGHCLYLFDWLLFFSFFVKAAEACQHCNTSWHYTHQRHPYVCLWVFGKLETSISSVFLTVYEFFFVFEIHHLPYHRYPLQKSFMALFFMDGRQDVYGWHCLITFVYPHTFKLCFLVFICGHIEFWNKKISINFVTI